MREDTKSAITHTRISCLLNLRRQLAGRNRQMQRRGGSRSGNSPELYRAPSGDITDTVMELAENRGMYNIKWSVDSIDWRKDMTKENILNRVLGRTESGSILLFHNDTQYTKDILPEIIDRLQKEDYKFVKVSSLIYKTDFYIDNTGKQWRAK